LIISTKKLHNPIVSVIVTTYNRQEYLSETILSILNQTFQDFELIIVDNFSNYDFFSLINSFNSDKIKALQNDNRGVIAANRNLGIREAQGEFIAFCDDDDNWMPEKLEIQMQVFGNKKNDLVYSNSILFFKSGAIVKTNYTPTSNLLQLLQTNHITLSSVVVRNSENLFFSEDSLLTGIEDYELWLRLKITGCIFYFIKDPLLKYRVLDTSFSSLSRVKNEKKILALKIRIFKNNKLSIILKLVLLYSILCTFITYLVLSLVKKK
jgi:glycosyltransferase involved in cell wall biosynthesis